MAEALNRASKLRCAIYTRKSSEEGLEQEFSSLQAQREACEAFITSQKGEGWQILPAHYDDGGWSGGTLDRPALERLLVDIRASKVDIVLVYKIDRLTRSLLDFAKIVEVFDAYDVSFVSVTQAFNTSTSMGRLTLNVLLSFAQFEREVTGERIRDKIAASKQKGMWMGGFVPLGYDAKDRRLVINKEEAETVRFIVRRYLELGSVYKLKASSTPSASPLSDASVPTARYGEGGPSRPGRFITCCEIRSIAAALATGGKAMKGCTKPSSRPNYGRLCSARFPSIGRTAGIGRVPRTPACFLA
jgi:site-specific DNA recombinase